MCCELSSFMVPVASVACNRALSQGFSGRGGGEVDNKGPFSRFSHSPVSKKKTARFIEHFVQFGRPGPVLKPETGTTIRASTP